MSALELWLTVDWQAPEPALRALERCTRAIRGADPAQLIVAAGTLPEEEARELLLAMINADPELSGRVASLPQIIVRNGDVPAEVEEHLRLPGPGEQALHVLREGLAPYVALTPVLNQEAWARTWQPEAGFRHLVVDNASDDDTAQILADRGADVIVNDERLSRVDNWRRALEVFLEIGDVDWMKWVFAGDRLLPGAADLLDAAVAAQPDARIICAEYQWKHPDGGVTRFHPLDETKVVATVEALYRFALQGNWMGGPIGLALHRDVISEVDFGGNLKTTLAVMKVGCFVGAYASKGAPEPALPFYPLLFGNVLVRFIQCYAMPDALRADGTRDLMRWCEDGRLMHPPKTILPLSEAAKAHELVESGTVTGKVLLAV